GRSSPSRARTSATFSGVARSPSIVSAGSPGMRWMKLKTRTETPSRTGTMVRPRRMAYRPTSISPFLCSRASAGGSLASLASGPGGPAPRPALRLARRPRDGLQREKALLHLDGVEVLRPRRVRHVALHALRERQRRLVVGDEEAAHVVAQELLGLPVELRPLRL